MAAYVIADVEVTNPEGYASYRSRVPGTLEPYSGRFNVRGGSTETLEGDWQAKRIVVIEFPSLEQARQWYTSPEYQEILPIRQQNARSRILLVEGV
jgi:uncharacterized protein (DUF1330 family)